MLRAAAATVAALLAAAAVAPPAATQSFTVPTHFEVVPLPGDYNLLVGLTFAPDGTAFVARKTGFVHVRNAAGQPQAALFIDLSAEINNDGDRGLLSIALHPGFVPDGGPTSWVHLAYLVSPVPPADNGFNQNNQYSFCRLTRYKATTGGSGTSHADDALLYYKISLSATDPGGLTGSAHVWVHPEDGLRDVAGTALPISSMDALVPPTPTGGGNHDIEVVRDGKTPAVGSGDSATQFDTSHGGAQGNDDWIGYALAAPPAEEQRFVAVEFQEGLHLADGGWWEDLRVEVRNGSTWSTAPGLTIDPPYPFALAGQPVFDELGFQTYTLRIDPSAGDAIRLRGNPAGSTGFVSVGELRVQAIAATPPSDLADIASQGTIVAKLFELTPPVPLGSGNPDPETIRNGTLPPVGSTSWLAQFDTSHLGQQGAEDGSATASRPSAPSRACCSRRAATTSTVAPSRRSTCRCRRRAAPG